MVKAAISKKGGILSQSGVHPWEYVEDDEVFTQRHPESRIW